MKKIFSLICAGLILLIFISFGWYSLVNKNAPNSDSHYGVSDSLYAVSKIQTYKDGRFLIGRRFMYGFQKRFIFRFNPDGSIDSTFTTGADLGKVDKDYDIFIVPSDILIQNEDKIIVGGHFGSYNGYSANNIVRLNSDGSRDATFNTGTGFGETVWTLAQQNEKILVGGDLPQTYNGEEVKSMVRLNPDGSLDNSFKFNDFGSVSKIVVMPDEKILVSMGSEGLIRLNSDGTRDNTFINHGFNGDFSSVNAILPLSNGKILIGGDFQFYGGTRVNGIARLMQDGSIDPDFNKGGFGFDVNDYNTNKITSIVIDNNGKIFVGGFFSKYNGNKVGNIVVMNENGDFNTQGQLESFDQNVNDLVIINNDLWVGGDFFKYGNKKAEGLVKIPLSF